MTVALGAEHDATWQAALDLWGVQLRRPEVAADPTVGAFAWFTFPPQVFVDLGHLDRIGATRHLVSVLAHEVGHHVLSPSTRLTSAKIRHQIVRTLQACDANAQLPMQETAAHLSNLWSDLLINVRVAQLQRLAAPSEEPDMVQLWRLLQRDAGEATPIAGSWWVVMRAYERLWTLLPGSLCPEQPPDVPDELHPDLDATLLAETVRTFGADPVSGALPLGMILAPYFVAADEAAPATRRERRGKRKLASVTSGVALGGCREDVGSPVTGDELADILADPRLKVEPLHPALNEAPVVTDPTEPLTTSQQQAYGLALTLALYADAPEEEVMAAWYENEARPWIKPLQEVRLTQIAEDLPGPLEVWVPGDDPDDIDWPATLRAGRVVPGVTTVRRTFLPDDLEARREAIDLDIYIDSSGSMPRPAYGSPAVLAGTILAHSILRGGGRVRITSFAGTGQVAGNSTFTRERVEAMRQLTLYYGGGTVFPLDLLAQRYLAEPLGTRTDVAQRRHLVVLSDDGLASMFGVGQPEFADVAAQVRTRLDTGTLLLMGVGRTRSGTGTDALATAAGYRVENIASIADAPRACAELARQFLEPDGRLSAHG